MMKIEHLTDNQLNAYFGDSALERDARHEIGRHLLQCDDCLKRLPHPTSAHFWAALMTNEIDAEFSEEKEPLAERLNFIASSLKKQNVLVLSAGALAVLLFFSAFIWLNAVKSSEPESEIARNFEIAPSVVEQTKTEELKQPSVIPSVANDNRSTDTPTSVSVEKKTKVTIDTPQSRNPAVIVQDSSKVRTQINLPNDKKPSISSTRGGAIKCGDEPPIDLAAVKISDLEVLLKWKKLPNAVKYHLYVSDDEEILLDEYETENETSYVLKKPLDAAKTYKWKLVVTLDGGKTLVGNAQKFTVKNLRSNQQKSEKKAKSEIRCTERN